MTVKRNKHNIAFIWPSRHLIFFRPASPGGNKSGWGFHHIRRRRDGTWSHTIVKGHVKPRNRERIPKQRGWRSYEITRWKSNSAVNHEHHPGNRITYKSYIRVKICPGGKR